MLFPAGQELGILSGCGPECNARLSLKMLGFRVPTQTWPRDVFGILSGYYDSIPDPENIPSLYNPKQFMSVLRAAKWHLT